MKSLIIFGAGATALALGVTIANGASVGPTVTAAYEQNQMRLRPTSGYGIGTGEAHVGDGSDRGYYTPGFSGGNGAARIGDGSDPDYQAGQRSLLTAPGRGGGNG